MTAEVERLLADARARLRGVPRDALGELREAHRTLGIRRAARIVPAGEAWHLGVLLLADDAVLATGEIVRAREEARRGYPAESQRRRAELAAAAARGGFAPGTAVHVGWRAIDVDGEDAGGSPILLGDGRARVRWSSSASLVPLEAYLDERIDLLQHPPERA